MFTHLHNVLMLDCLTKVCEGTTTVRGLVIQDHTTGVCIIPSLHNSRKHHTGGFT